MSAADNLRKLADGATPGPWKVTEPEDSWHFRLASITCLGTSSAADLYLVEAAPDAVVLLARALDALADFIEEFEPEQHRGSEPWPEAGHCRFCDSRAILADADRLFGDRDTGKDER